MPPFSKDNNPGFLLHDVWFGESKLGVNLVSKFIKRHLPLENKYYQNNFLN